MWKTISSNPMPQSALGFAFFASSEVLHCTASARDWIVSRSCSSRSARSISEDVIA
jgi:hypothetical protein